MFTGIVHGQGTLMALEKSGGQMRLRIHPLFAWNNPQIGESVAVNGTCLTMETWDAAGPFFSVYASMETMKQTALGTLRIGHRINLERALALGDRLGGHMVSGHVDTVAHVEGVRREGDSRRFRLNFDQTWSTLVIAKGSVALDGISLTVNQCAPGWLEVNVIPETWRVTTVADWKPGQPVNLETDMIGKYVHHALAPYNGEQSSSQAAGLTVDFLREHGF